MKRTATLAFLLTLLLTGCGASAEDEAKYQKIYDDCIVETARDTATLKNTYKPNSVTVEEMKSDENVIAVCKGRVDFEREADKLN